MTAKRLSIGDLPAWSRYLRLNQAAAWAGVSPDVFMREVKAGIWPQPRMRGAKASLATWDRTLLDRAADYAAGLVAAPAPVDQEAVDQDIRNRIRAANEKRRGGSLR